jgi:3D (Asp-Asp-Asp) domain-containing protein
MRMMATAYCLHGPTESGAQTRRGTMAADPRVIPVGSVVSITSPVEQYSGTYTVTDTGAKVKGHRVDIFVPSCGKAKAFGKRVVQARMVRRGPAGDATSR